MKAKSRYIVILGILFGYIILQFMWWEILLVKQTGKIINEEQKLVELTSTNNDKLLADIEALHARKKMQTIMIVGEGTVFLLLLLFGIYKVKQAIDKEAFLNKQQNNFLLSITHELKTPIAATKLQLQTLQKQKLNQETQNELISAALRETERLNLLIDNVLLASSLDNGQLIFKPEKCNMAVEIEAIVNRYFKREMEIKSLQLQLESNVEVLIDRHAFPSVITNLIGNAIKYSPNEKDITLNLKQNGGLVLLSVSDNGYGISDADKPNVFKRFFRAGNEETRSSKGTGLGLFIVKYILDGHQAKIKVKDNTPQGSIFEIEFHAA